jgi:hypothetical protein
MLAEEPAPSRQLTIAGTLWKLNRDEVFVDCLNRMKTGDTRHLKSAHFNQIMWLGDARAIDYLIELLDDEDHFIRFLALSALNSIEHQQHFLVPESQLPSHPILYQARRFNLEFRAKMVANLQGRNAAMTNGR